MKSPWRFVALPVALSLLLAACGTDGEPAPTTAPPAPATPPTDVTTTAPPPSTTGAQPTAGPATTTADTSTTAAPATTAAATTTEPPATTTSEPGPTRIKVDVYDGIAAGEPRVTVERGDQIELVVTSDVSDEVHVHGYDFKAHVTPDAAAVIAFVADLPGIYEIELEDSGLLLFELEVR